MSFIVIATILLLVTSSYFFIRHYITRILSSESLKRRFGLHVERADISQISFTLDTSKSNLNISGLKICAKGSVTWRFESGLPWRVWWDYEKPWIRVIVRDLQVDFVSIAKEIVQPTLKRRRTVEQPVVNAIRVLQVLLALLDVSFEHTRLNFYKEDQLKAKVTIESLVFEGKVQAMENLLRRHVEAVINLSPIVMTSKDDTRLFSIEDSTKLVASVETSVILDRYTNLTVDGTLGTWYLDLAAIQPIFERAQGSKESSTFSIDPIVDLLYRWKPSTKLLLPSTTIKLPEQAIITTASVNCELDDKLRLKINVEKPGIVMEGHQIFVAQSSTILGSWNLIYPLTSEKQPLDCTLSIVNPIVLIPLSLTRRFKSKSEISSRSNPLVQFLKTGFRLHFQMSIENGALAAQFDSEWEAEGKSFEAPTIFHAKVHSVKGDVLIDSDWTSSLVSGIHLFPVTNSWLQGWTHTLVRSSAACLSVAFIVDNLRAITRKYEDDLSILPIDIPNDSHSTGSCDILRYQFRRQVDMETSKTDFSNFQISFGSLDLNYTNHVDELAWFAACLASLRGGQRSVYEIVMDDYDEVKPPLGYRIELQKMNVKFLDQGQRNVLGLNFKSFEWISGTRDYLLNMDTPQQVRVLKWLSFAQGGATSHSGDCKSHTGCAAKSLASMAGFRWEWVEESYHPPQKGSENRIVMGQVDASLGLQEYYCFLANFIHLMPSWRRFRLRQLLHNLPSDAEAMERDRLGIPHPPSRTLNLICPKVCIDLWLPTELPLRFMLDKISWTNSNGKMAISSRQFTVQVHESGPGCNEDFFVMTRLRFTKEPYQHEKFPSLFGLFMEEMRAVVPFHYQFDEIVENGVNAFKAIKHVNAELRGETFVPKIGNDMYIPPLDIAVKLITVKMLDSPFEAHLSRWYLLGKEEQARRLEREEILRTRLGSMLQPVTDVNRELDQDPSAKAALNLLQEADALEWKSVIKTAGESLPPMMTSLFGKVRCSLRPPQLVNDSVEETIRSLDPSIPPDYTYDTKIPFSLVLETLSTEVHFRDYSFPVLSMPEARENHSSYPLGMRMTALGVIAEQDADQWSTRHPVVSFGKARSGPIAVRRTVAPTKMYWKSDLYLNTPGVVTYLGYGASYEPIIADLFKTTDYLTPLSRDLSLKLPYWDKYRNLIHGTCSIRLVDDGEWRFRVVGSASPYANSSTIPGIEFVFRKGNSILIGADEDVFSHVAKVPNPHHTDRKYLCINSGEVQLLLSRSSPKEKDKMFGKFVGGVKLAIGIEFVPDVFDPQGWSKPHYAIKLKDSGNPNLPEEMRQTDSYSGYRSKEMRLTVEILSGGQNSGFNSLHLDLDLINYVNSIMPVFASPVTALRIHTGKVFGDFAPPKTKFSRVMTSIKIYCNFAPVVVGWTQDLEDKDGAVSMRFRSSRVQVAVEAMQRRPHVAPPSPKSKNVGKKKGSLWGLDVVDLSFEEVELRAIGMGAAVPPRQLNTILSEEWLTERDQPYIAKGEFWSQLVLSSPRVLYFKNLTDHSSARVDDAVKAERVLVDARIQEIKQEMEKNPLPELQKSLEALQDYVGDSTESESQRLARSRLVAGSGGFTHYYVIHSARIRWSQPVRNTAYLFTHVVQQANSLVYYLSNAAIKMAKDVQAEKPRQPPEPVPVLHVPTSPTTRTFVDDLLRKLTLDKDQIITDAPQNVVKQADTSPASPDTSYRASADSASPDFVPEGFSIRQGFLIQFVNAQITLEVPIREESDECEAILIVAGNTHFKSVGLIEGEWDPMREGSSDWQSHVWKTRRVLKVEDAQFFCVPSTKTWPVWAPIELSLDPTLASSFPQLQRFIDGTSVKVHQDVLNDLYVASTTMMPDRWSSGDEAKGLLRFTFPDLNISTNSSQFALVYNVVSNLLVYSLPDRKTRRDRVTSTALLISQLDDVEGILASVLSLQAQVRESNDAIKRQKTEEDLIVMMEALKNVNNQRKRQKSAKIAIQANLDAKKVLWNMMDDVTFCQWTLKNLQFVTRRYEDQSSINLMEMDSLHIENLASTRPEFKDAVSPFVDEDRKVDLSRQKMLRIYWRVLAPVGGITIVEHFEINMVPTALRVTYDLGKRVLDYFFPDKRPTRSSLVNLRGSSKTSATDMTRDDLDSIVSRSSVNRTFVYIKVPGVQHCLSYRGEKEKNIEDVDSFVFRLPSLEWHNKTWSYYELLQAVKKEVIRAVWQNAKLFLKERLFSRRRESIVMEQPSTIPTDAFPAVDSAKKLIVFGQFQ